MLQDLDTQVVYRNPKPYLRSVHASFPSVVEMPDGELIAVFVLGEAFEAVNLRLHKARSTDGGETWRHEGQVFSDIEGNPVSEAARISLTPEGEIFMVLWRADRSEHIDEGLANEATLGMAPNQFLTCRSADGGRSWTTPEPLASPLEGPGFELCSPITVLNSSRWLLPTSTWPSWDGHLPNGHRMVAFISEDRGRIWPRYADVMVHPSKPVNYWESKIVALPDERLLAVAWAYDTEAKRDLPNQYAISSDGGATWTPPASMELTGQTLTPLVLDDGRILCVYRRMDISGLWAQLAHLDGERWVNGGAEPLWGHNAGGLTRTSESMAKNFQSLRFGAPCLTRLEDGRILVAFWCYEDCVGIIRTFRFRL